MDRVKRFILWAMVGAACALPVECATLQRLSLNDMIGQSTTIVRGTVTASWAAFAGPVVYTHYRVQVAEQFKGAAGNSVEIMVPGGAAEGKNQNFSGSPILNQGGEFVFFLWTSKSGITWITGLTQGLFTLAPGAPGTDRVATRAASRELMLDATTSRPVKDAALSMKLSDLRSLITATLAAQGGVK